MSRMAFGMRASALIAVVLTTILLTAAPSFASTYDTWASFYGYGDYTAGNLTASGEVFNPYDYTAASTVYPFGTVLEVCYDGCVQVRVNDYGPAPWTGRSLDLSYQAAADIGMFYVGVDEVQVTEIYIP
jgi:rare lipoprotein A